MTVRPPGAVTPVATSQSLAPTGKAVAPDALRRFELAVRTAALPLPGGNARAASGAIGAPIADVGKFGAEERDIDAGGADRVLPDALMYLWPSPPPPAPLAPAAAVGIDPSVFADMMDQLWLREQNRQTREMKVKFGDSAWPETGASVLRLDDGSLSITVGVAPHGLPGDLERLKRQSAERGLPVREVVFATDS